MKIIGRWDETDPYDAILRVDADLNFSSRYSVSIPLVLESPSKLLTTLNNITFLEAGQVEVNFKLNLETSSASTSKNFDSVVVFLSLNDVIVPDSIAYAQPNPSAEGNLTCISDFELKANAGDVALLYAYRIMSRGYVGVKARESRVSIKRRKVYVNN